ncbi:MAG: hydantoinase/oxoprolinase family protein [Candidatus Binataceae bacterium]|nr:hydantoinase/oxoprolinase family protein [Candidatus Binataceae bacterium]
MFTIDLDIGSTCTDGFFTDGQGFRLSKVLTTPHDLAECTINCIAAGASQFGLELKDFLHETAVCRLSSTLGTNLVVQHTGTRLGLLVTGGHEQDLYGAIPRAPILDLFVPSAMVLGLSEEVDNDGRVRQAPDRDEVLNRVRALLELGARMVVVSLRNAWRDPANEHLVRSFVHERYPVQYLRSVPIQIGSEIVHAADDHARTNSAVLNAYIHPPMARSLYRIEDRLRDHGYNRPLLVVHAHGGSGRIAKTVALHTLSSGPASAVRGASELCKLFGIPRALTIDMGGTSLDAAVIKDHSYRLERHPELNGVRLAIPMVAVDSIAAGGSTIARVSGGRITVGPQSAGIAPGPACYGRGGTEPTIADVNLVLGYIDPEYFLGGALKLDRSRAERALQRHIASPLKLEVAAAASAIRDEVTAIMSESLRRLLKQSGDRPESFTMLVLGGSGALHACAIAERIGIYSMLAFPYSSVFSAFGASTTDVQHSYSHTMIISPQSGDRVSIARELESLLQQARRDMEGEGFSQDRISLSLHALVTDLAAEPITVAHYPNAEVSGLRLSDDLHTHLKHLTSSASITVEINIAASASVPHWVPSGSPVGQGHKAIEPRLKSKRMVYWNARESHPTPIFDHASLMPGVIVEGPAIVESPITNYVIAPNWRFTVDARNNFVFERKRN